MKNIFFIVALMSTTSYGQIITTIAGNGVPAYTGNGGAATSASLDGPNGVAVDQTGNIYVSEYWNHTIRKITPSGIITTCAGNGSPGYSGDGGQATAAQLNYPVKIAVDRLGNIFIADRDNNRIREVSTSGIITTIAGTGYPGYNGDGITATTAQINSPCGVDVDTMGNIYIADFSNNRIRKVSSGMIYTIAGTGTTGSFGDGGMATNAQLDNCFGVRINRSGNIFIADNSNNKIRVVSTTGIITTFAGNGTVGYSGDGYAATDAEFNDPAGIAFDTLGNVYIADQLNNVIRMVSTSGIITTILGTGTPGYNGDGLSATATEINGANEIDFDLSQHLLFTDNLNHRVRMLASSCFSITHQPANDTVLPGNTAKYWVVTAALAPTYQWQQNAGAGWVNMANTWPYSGVFTDTLTIHNASLYIDTTHYRCVVSDDADGIICVDTSSSAVLYINTADEGVNNPGIPEVNIYPNPAHNNVTIYLPEPTATGNVQLMDAVGQVLIEESIKNTTSLDIQQLPAGVYIIKVDYDHQSLYKKLIKL